MKKTNTMFLSLFFFFVGIWLLSESNSGFFYNMLAEYNYSIDKKDKALKYYERAFELGYKSAKSGNIYAGILLNPPVGTESQMKLVKFLQNSDDDVVKYKAELFFTDLKGDIQKKYPDNYISQATYNQKVLRWSHNPITYDYYNEQKAPEYFINEIDNAFSVWEANSDNKVSFKRVKENPDIVIRFNTKKTKADDMEKYIVAYTQPVIVSNVLKNMVTDYYLTSPDGNYFTQNQVYNTALHEIGHALGIMGHCDFPKSIMYMSTDILTVTNYARKDLTLSDINTLKLLYSISPEITDKGVTKSEYIPYIVLGDENKVTGAKLREAQLYIKKTPNLPQGYIDLADAYVTLEEYPKAVKALNKALSLAGEDEILSVIYYNLAVSYYLMSDYKTAKNYLEKSGSMQAQESARRLLAEIYCALGEKTSAIAEYEGLILKYPENIEYVIALTNIYVRDKQYLKARAVLKEFVNKNPKEKNNPKLSSYGIIKAFL